MGHYLVSQNRVVKVFCADEPPNYTSPYNQGELILAGKQSSNNALNMTEVKI